MRCYQIGAGEFAPYWAALFMSQTKHEDFAKREAIPEPTWNDFFLPGQHSAFIRILGLDSERAMAYLRAALPLAVERYLRAKQREARPGLAERRRKLQSVRNQAHKLRKALLNLEGFAKVDFLTTATHYSGSGFTVDPQKPSAWYSDAGRLVRDVAVVAGAAADQLKARARRGGRPSHAAARILVDDLAFIYERLTKCEPGRRGRFPRFAKTVVEVVDSHLANTGLEHLIREMRAERKKLDKNA